MKRRSDLVNKFQNIEKLNFSFVNLSKSKRLKKYWNCQSERSRRLFSTMLLVFDYARTDKKYNYLPFQNYLKYLLICCLCLIQIIGFSNIANAQNGGKKWAEPTNLRVLNSAGDDFAPQFSNIQNLFYFNSDREGKSYFYVSNLSDSGNFYEPKLLKSEINIIGKYQSYITFPAGNEAFFSTYRKSGKQSFLNIYRTIFQKNNWTEPFPVDSIAVDAFCSHVTVSPDGTIMIFASTRGTHSEDIDLWMSYRNENGYWSSPISVDELNSSGNEITPFLLSSDTLYFSSDGYEGPGAYDIYYSIRTGNTWNRPKPLFDFNSEFNESDFTILPDGRAVFASDRPGGVGKLDLYIAQPVRKNEALENEKLAEISIGTQVSNIIAEKRNVLSHFPAFHFFSKQSFELKENKFQNTIDSLIFEYPKMIAEYLRTNTNEILVIDSSDINKQIIDFFVTKGINKERIIIQKGFERQNAIKFKLLSGNPLPVIELSQNFYTYKPPVVEISIGSRENIAKGIHSLSFITSKKRHDIFINDTKLPVRDIVSLDEYDSEVFDSDSLIIHYKINSDRAILADAKRILFVSRQELRETKIITEGNDSYAEYFLILPDNIFFDSDYFSSEYLNLIKENLTNNLKVRLVYYNDSMKSQANKVKDLLLTGISGKKQEIKVEKENYNNHKSFSRDLSDMVIRIMVYKRQ